jgi:superfamily II DNA or RNA helicase
MNRELWQHQSEGMTALRQSIAQGVRRIVLQAPTGSGKTLMAAAIADGAIRKGNRLAFVVNAIGLIDQTVEAFYSEGIREIGVIQANHGMTDWSKPVQVCSIQTLRSRQSYPEAKVVVFDECHSLHDFHKQWLSAPGWENVPFIGLSATPWSKGLGKYFHSLLVVSTTQELIDKGFLSKFKVYCTGQPDLSGVKIVAGEYVQDQLADAMQQGTLTADIVRTWQQLWGKPNTLVFGVDRRHAETIHYRFEEIGVRSAYQDGETPPAERQAIKRGFHNGTYDVVCNIGTLCQGVDWDVRCLVLARPTKSEILYTQILGRALRTATNKDHAVILDHSNSTLELGLVTDIHHDHLDDGNAQKNANAAPRKKPLPRPCPQCSAIVPRLNRTCVECGHTLPLMSDVVERDGVLVEYVPGQSFVGSGAKRQYTVLEKEQFYGELLGYAREHGYKEGWISHKYREKFGVWPNGMRHVMAEEPSFEVAQWIRSRNIAWAKSKNNPMRQAAE